MKMNLSGFIDEDDVTFELFDVNETEHQQQQPYDVTSVNSFYDVVQYVCMTLGIPGNILSAIVWLRLHVASKNSSAVYLAALAVNDLVYLLNELRSKMIRYKLLNYCSKFLRLSITYIEPLLVFGFSVERLIAICCPLQVAAYVVDLGLYMDILK